MSLARKPRILIADDSEMNREILADMLQDEYEIIEAANGLDAVSLLEEHGPTLSLVLLDIVMPEMDGFGVLAAMNDRDWLHDLPVIMISSESSPDVIERAYRLGITDYISRPFNAAIVHHRVNNTILLNAKQKKLTALVAEQVRENVKQSDMMIDILSHIVEFRNGESGLHVIHIRILTELLLQQLAEKTDQYHLTPAQIKLISTASALHDIGKIAIPNAILNKPGRFTDEEFAVMKTHSMIGATILEGLEVHRDEPLVKVAYEICRWHHERYDGRGYPDGLKGDQIPISAQIVALADVYDALTSQRVYKPPFPHGEAIRMICNGECGAFHPLLLECLTELSDRIRVVISGTVVPSEDQTALKDVTDEIIRREEASASEHVLELLNQERDKFQILARISGECLFEYTPDPPVLTMPAWSAKRLGLPETIRDPLEVEMLRGRMRPKTLAGIQEAVRAATPDQSVIEQVCFLSLGGDPRWVRLTGQVMWSEEDPLHYASFLGKLVDIHAEKLRLDALERMASHDVLTGLLNRGQARKDITQRLEEAPETCFALAVVDLDNFKFANDVHGHQFGDRVLMEAARRLSGAFDESAVVARFGGDEFLVFTKAGPEAEAAFQRAYLSLGQNYEQIPMSVSLGIATTDDVGYQYDALFQAADQAMYAAKRSGRNQILHYDPSMRDLFPDPLPRGTKKE